MTYLNEASPVCRTCGEPSKCRGLCQHHYYKSRALNKIPVNSPTKSQVAWRAKIRRILDNAKGRCRYPGTHKYEYYGGRGIQCRLSFEDIEFLWRRDSANQMQHPSLDRIERDGNYTKENCRFIEFDLNRRLRSKPRPNRQCIDCKVPFVGAHPRALRCKTCGDNFRRPKRSCRICSTIFNSSSKSKDRCKNCQWETRLCAYCHKPITRKIDIAYGRNKNWFCSKREFGLWICYRRYHGTSSLK